MVVLYELMSVTPTSKYWVMGRFAHMGRIPTVRSKDRIAQIVILSEAFRNADRNAEFETSFCVTMITNSQQ